MKEAWKDVLGYEGLYQVSNLGRVKSLSRQTTSGKIVNSYRTLHEAARAVNGWPQNIWHCVRGKALTAYGYKWRYSNAKS